MTDELIDDEIRKAQNKSPQADSLGQAIRQLDETNKEILELHFLHGFSLRKSYELAGVAEKYENKNAFKVKVGKFAGIYIEYLKGRQLVLQEFGIDMPKAVELIKMRDKANKVGDMGPAIRAHEMILKLMGDLGAGAGKGGGKKGGEDEGETREPGSKRDEIIGRLNKIQQDVTGESADIPSSYDISSDDELSEVVKENSAPPGRYKKKKSDKMSKEDKDESA